VGGWLATQWLLNDEFAAAFQRVTDLQQRKGLALVDIVRELTPCVYLCPRSVYPMSGWTAKEAKGRQAVASAPLLPLLLVNAASNTASSVAVDKARPVT
jgi:hypothetical protein